MVNSNEDSIKGYVDREGFNSDTEFVIAQLNRALAIMNELEKKKINPYGSSKDLFKALEDLGAKQKELLAISDKLIKAGKAEAEISLKNAKAKTEEAKASYNNARAMKEEAAAKAINEKMTKSLNKEIGNLNKERIKEEERLGKLNNAYEQLKAKYTIAANTAKQLAAAKGLDNEETKEAIAVSQQYYNQLINIEKAVGQSQRNVGNYTQATFALTQVLREAPAFANSFATGISAISNNVPMLLDQFKLLRAETGSSFKALKILGGALFSFQALLPIGFLLIQSYGKEIGNFFRGLFSSAEALNKFKASQQELNKAMEAADYKKASIEVKEMSINIDLAKKGLLNKKEVLNVYNKSLGETIGQAKDLNEAEGLLIKNGPAYLKMTLLKAAANQALNEAAKLSVELALEQNTVSASFVSGNTLSTTLRRTEAEQKFGEEIRKSAEYMKLSRAENDAFNRSLSERTPENIAAYEKLKGSAQAFYEEQLSLKSGGKKAETKKTLEGIATDFITQAAEISKNFNIDFFGGSGDDKSTQKAKDNADKILEYQEQTRKSIFERMKAQKEEEIKAAEEIANNDKATFQQRLEASQVYYDKNLELLTLSTEFEKNENQKQTQQALSELQKRGKEDKLTRSQIEAERNAIISNGAEKEKTIIADLNTNIIELDRKSAKQRTDIAQDEANRIEAIRKENAEKGIKNTENEAAILALNAELTKNKKLFALSEQFRDGLIKEREYQVKRREIEEEYLIESINAQIRAAETIIEIRKSSGLDTADAETKLAKLKIDLQNEVLKNGIKVNEELQKNDEAAAKERSKQFVKYVKLAADAISGIVGLLNVDAEKNLNLIQDSIDQLDRQKAKDIEVASQTITNAQDRAAAITEIEKRAAAQKTLLEQKQRQEKNKQAQAEKLALVSKAIADGISAVQESLPDIPLSILVGSIAALNVAKLISTPVPKYKDGTTDHKGGPAIVGDGGRRELVITPDGNISQTPATATLVNLPKHSVVLPDASKALAGTSISEVERLMNGYRYLLNSGAATQNDETATAIKTMSKDVVNAIKKIPQPIISTPGPITKRIRHGDNSNTYLNGNLQG